MNIDDLVFLKLIFKDIEGIYADEKEVRIKYKGVWYLIAGSTYNKLFSMAGQKGNIDVMSWRDGRAYKTSYSLAPLGIRLNALAIWTET